MKKVKTVLVVLVILALLGGGGGLYYYLYEDSHFYYTDDAQVTANFVTITPMVTGKVTNWDIQEGDSVKAGQVLGHQDISTLVTSSAINSQALSSSADSIASKADIKSPIDGRIIETSVVPGEVLSPGMDAATVADTSNIFIRANIEETNIFKINPGQLVDITVDAYPGKLFQGYIQSIALATQDAFSTGPSLNTSGNFSKVTQLIPVKISIANSENLTLIPGMNAEVKVHIKGN